MVGLISKNEMDGMTMWQRREALRNRADVQFVEPEQFCSLAVSCRKISRADDSAAGLKGLYCEDDGFHYFVEVENLDQYREGSASSQPSFELA